MRMYVMPQDQGQIVTVSYGCDGEYLYRRTVDAYSTTWARVRLDQLDDDEPIEPWNGRLPKVYDDEWETVSIPKGAAR